MAGVLIDGFSTLIAKSFVQTGRIFDNGVWRLKQKGGFGVFADLLGASAYEDAGLSYRLPDHAHDELSTRW